MGAGLRYPTASVTRPGENVMRAIFINLDRASDRRQWVESQAATLGFALERHAAVDGASLMPPEGGHISAGALACFHSHREAWKLVASGDEPYAAIFEDDVHLSSDLPRFLSDASWIPADADIVHLGRSRERCVVINAGFNALDRKLYRTVTENSGTEGYIILRQCARRLYAEFTDIAEEEFDILMFDKNAFDLTVYKMIPSLCIQDQFVEEPRFDGQIERKPSKMKRGSRLGREAARQIVKLKRGFTRLLGLKAPIRIRVTFR